MHYIGSKYIAEKLLNILVVNSHMWTQRFSIGLHIGALILLAFSQT